MQGGLGRKLIYRLVETRLGPTAIGSYSIERYTLLAISYLLLAIYQLLGLDEFSSIKMTVHSTYNIDTTPKV